ncbi:MAG: hypothetical protein U0793_25920 [Gemmataceae bacterium]
MVYREPTPDETQHYGFGYAETTITLDDRIAPLVKSKTWINVRDLFAD